MGKKQKIFLASLGALVGFLNASIGLGGAILAIPFLVLVLKLKLKDAMLLSLFVVTITSAIGIVTHSIINIDNIQIFVALFLALGTVIGAKLGAYLSSIVNTRLLTKIFAVIILLAALKITGIVKFADFNAMQVNWYSFSMAGLVIGTVSATLGIGGGILIVPFLMFATEFSGAQIVATSVSVIFPTALSASVFRMKYQKPDFEKLKYIVPTIIVGSLLGAYFANHVPEYYLKIMVGLFISYSGIKMLLKK